MVLVPELDVTDLDAALGFYTDVLGFEVVFQRRAERFTYLERDGVELMVEEAAGPGRRFHTAPLETPFGRGVNFQLPVDDVDAVHARTTGRWAVEGPTEAGNRQFVVADPDGYLWRPFRDLGVRSAG